jgi:hypothetical protein
VARGRSNSTRGIAGVRSLQSMSEGKSKGVLSLRKKKTVTRPKISAPTLISAPSNDSTTSLRAPTLAPSQSGSASNLSVPQPRPSINGTDKTADLVKRRYSTRFAQPQDSELPPPVPGLPQLPAQYASEPPGRKSGRSPARSPNRREGGQRINIDLKPLRDPHLQPEQCPFVSFKPPAATCYPAPPHAQLLPAIHFPHVLPLPLPVQHALLTAAPRRCSCSFGCHRG